LSKCPKRVVNGMLKEFSKKEEETSPFEESVYFTEKDNEEAETALLQKLKNEEASLREQKENLYSLRKQLQQKAKEEIELKKSRIRKLKSEITDLKDECEKLSNSLRSI
jgi:chromosome segregation ATPase